MKTTIPTMIPNTIRTTAGFDTSGIVSFLLRRLVSNLISYYDWRWLIMLDDGP